MTRADGEPRLDLSERLAAAYAGIVPLGDVLRAVSEARSAVDGQGGCTDAAEVDVEARARATLDELVQRRARRSRPKGRAKR